MNSLKKFLGIVAAISGIGMVGFATDIPVQRFVVGPADTEIYELDDDGDSEQTGGIKAGSKTIAQINALTAPAAGQIVVCSNCVSTAICISSGTGRGAYTVPMSTAPTTGTLPAHCF